MEVLEEDLESAWLGLSIWELSRFSEVQVQPQCGVHFLASKRTMNSKRHLGLR
jgi:hypothetical protein